MVSEVAIRTIRESCYRVGYPTYDAEHKRRILINQSCDYAIECIEKLDKIEQIVKDSGNFKGENTAHNKYVKIAEIILEREQGYEICRNR